MTRKRQANNNISNTDNNSICVIWRNPDKADERFDNVSGLYAKYTADEIGASKVCVYYNLSHFQSYTNNKIHIYRVRQPKDVIKTVGHMWVTKQDTSIFELYLKENERTEYYMRISDIYRRHGRFDLGICKTSLYNRLCKQLVYENKLMRLTKSFCPRSEVRDIIKENGNGRRI